MKFTNYSNKRINYFSSFNFTKDQILETHRLFKSPILHLPKVYDTIEIVKDPNLHLLDFIKVYDPYAAYQEIFQFENYYIEVKMYKLLLEEDVIGYFHHLPYAQDCYTEFLLGIRKNDIQLRVVLIDEDIVLFSSERRGSISAWDNIKLELPK